MPGRGKPMSKQAALKQSRRIGKKIEASKITWLVVETWTPLACSVLKILFSLSYSLEYKLSESFNIMDLMLRIASWIIFKEELELAAVFKLILYVNFLIKKKRTRKIRTNHIIE